jgi:hypothetical protein
MTTRHEFANNEDLFDHLAETLPNAERVDGGVRGAGGPRLPGTDPVLKAVTSPAGTMLLANKPIDVMADPSLPPAPNIANLRYTGDVNGAQRWAAPDGSVVQYRKGAEMLTFDAWKKSTFYQYWSMGGEISTVDGADFEAAQVDSRYYMTLPGKPCSVVKVGSESATNTNYIDEYQWGWNSPQPERVASLCRAQWHGARFADLVTVGTGCDSYAAEPWPTGYPANWPPITGYAVAPTTINLGKIGLGLTASGTITVTNHGPTDLPVHIEPAQGNTFSHPAGDLTAPADSILPIAVTFTGGSHAGSFTTQVRLEITGQTFVIPVSVQVTASGIPK